MRKTEGSRTATTQNGSKTAKKRNTTPAFDPQGQDAQRLEGLKAEIKRIERKGLGGRRRAFTEDQLRVFDGAEAAHAAVKDADEQLRQKQLERAQAFQRADAARISLAHLAEVCGISYQRVQQIISSDVAMDDNPLDVSSEAWIEEAVQHTVAEFIAAGLDRNRQREIDLLERVLASLAAANVSLRESDKKLAPRHVAGFLTDFPFRMSVYQQADYFPPVKNAFDPDTGAWYETFTEDERKALAEPLIEIARKL